jgi:hypothetical protein
VEAVYELTDEQQLTQLAGLHIHSEATVRERFHYRRPSLFVLVPRIYRTPTVVSIPNTPAITGCRSWVELETPISIEHLMPVQTTDEFAAVTQDIVARIRG